LHYKTFITIKIGISNRVSVEAFDVWRSDDYQYTWGGPMLFFQFAFI
jgi:hypothetical protein